MTITKEVAGIFADAHLMYTAAMERLAANDVRDASEKAWCATKRATDALILARTGEEPEKSPETTRGLDTLASHDPAVRPLGRPVLFEASSTARTVFLLRLVRPSAGNRQAYTGDYWIH